MINLWVNIHPQDYLVCYKEEEDGDRGTNDSELLRIIYVIPVVNKTPNDGNQTRD